MFVLKMSDQSSVEIAPVPKKMGLALARTLMPLDLSFVLTSKMNRNKL
jgi:hypothetical protein